MQIETLQNVPKEAAKSYLRVASISNKTALRFFYIGNDPNCIDLLTDSFQDGDMAEDFESAKKMIAAEHTNPIDAIIIDIPYSETELKAFYFFLKNRNLQTTPLIYNQRQLKNIATAFDTQFIDDAIDLLNWQFDFYTKITFLKKCKEQAAATSGSTSTPGPDRFVIKRVIDVILASTLLILLLPLFIIIAIAIKLESRGPVFYNANRAGRGFKIFKFYKFRTMEVNADKKIEALAHLNQYQGASVGARFFKISNDPRITRVGRFLRNTSLDELPQLINVIKGDMSLVGNRPLPLYEAATLTTNEFVERFMAPAGITGLWQIKKRGRAEMSIDERIELDISYARKACLVYDFLIMAKTPAALFQKSDV